MTFFSLSLGLVPLVSLCAAAPSPNSWHDQVAPFITADERSACLVLRDDLTRENFIRQFWSSTQLGAEEYYRRLAHTDANYGSGKLLSRYRTDRGRVYLTLGAPNKVTHLASSRIFFPIEIWDDSAPALSLNYQLHPDREWSAIGRQWLVRGNMAEARKCFARAQSIRPSDQNAIDLARIAALAGDLDSPRHALREILARDPGQFEALTLMGYIEARLEDYAVAANYYERALAVRRSLEILKALNEVKR